MRTDKEILEEYKNANMAKRLNFYVQYRELRDEFSQMDVKNGKGERKNINLICRPKKRGKKNWVLPVNEYWESVET